VISVIIPVYNVKPYLDNCLKSVVTQSYEDFECILVDDGSTDGSSEICDCWAIQDKRIKVLHQANQGVSVARNNGIKYSKGNYITFIDSDDWVEQNYMSDMLENIEKTQTDLVVSGLVRNFINGESSKFVPIENKRFHLTKDSVENFVDLNRKFLLFGPVVKLYKRDIIRDYGICFPPNQSYGEDLMFNFKYLEHIDTISCVARCNYHYRILGQGTLASRFRPDQFKTDYEQWRILFAFYKRRSLLCEVSYEYLYNRLWGIVYDGLFLYPKLEKAGLRYIKNVLSVSEIKDLSRYRHYFDCSGWIKTAVCHRMFVLFYLYFLLRKKR